MSEAAVSVRSQGRVFKNLLVLYGSQVLTSILSLAPIAFVPRYLDAAGIGRIVIAGAFVGILTKLIMLGTGAYIVREIARDRGRLSEVLASTIALRLGLAILLAPVTALLLFLFDYPAETNTIVMIMYASLTIRMISFAFGEGLQGLENMTWRSAATVAQEVVAVAIGWLVLRNGGGVLGYVIVLSASDVIACLVHGAYFVLRYPFRPTVRWTTIVEIFRGGLPFFLWAFIQTIYFHTSSLMLSKLGGEAEAGWYGVANQFIVPLFMIPSVIITVLLPRFSQLSQEGPGPLRAAVTRAMSYMTIVTMPMAFGLAAISGRLMSFFDYPATFDNSVPVLQVLAFMLPGTSMLMLAACTLTAMNKERGWARVSIFSLGAAVVLNGALIPVAKTYGNAALGAAAAGLAVELLTYIWALRLIGREMFDSSVFVVFAKACLASLVMAATAIALYMVPLPIAIVTAGLVYAGAVLLLDLIPADDLHFARTLVARRLQGPAPRLAAIVRGQ